MGSSVILAEKKIVCRFLRDPSITLDTFWTDLSRQGLKGEGVRCREGAGREKREKKEAKQAM